MTTRRCGEEVATPTQENDAGLSELSYRVGTWATFLDAMKTRLGTMTVPGSTTPPLQALASRAPDDGTIALLDAWAVAADVVSFYTERIVNEGFLGTATRTRSLAELAAMVGYQRRPGVAASTWLAFTTSPTLATPVTVAAATPVMSVPGQGESAQTFETDADLEVRPEWTSLPVAQRLPVPATTTGVEELLFDGVATRLEVGAPLLIVGRERGEHEGSERWEFRRVRTVEADATAGTTHVILDRPLGTTTTSPPSDDVHVYTFRDRAGIFGAAAPDWRLMSDDIKTAFGGGSGWPGFSLSEEDSLDADPPAIDLDREYPKIGVGSWVVFEDRYQIEAFEVVKVSPNARTDFSLSARVTRLGLDGNEHLARMLRRRTVVHVQSEELTRIGPVDTTDVTGTSVDLEVVVGADIVGRLVAISGTRSDTGAVEGQVRTIVGIGTAADGVSSRIDLDADVGPFLRSTVTANANVVPASHGATVSAEILGSGDGSVAWASFKLAQSPLTWVADTSGQGASSTLTVYVNGVAWTRVDTFYGQAPDAQVYTLRLDADGRTVVGFGDGITGARLPTGSSNLVATYRKGLGLDGEVRAGTLTLLSKRPAGILAVTNPTAATGAADPEEPEDIKANASLQVRTVDRLVTLGDYDVYAASWAGVGKASASLLWDGQRRLVHLTVATASGESADATEAPVSTLASAVAIYKDPAHTVIVDGFEDRRFGLDAKLVLRAGADFETVDAAVRAALASTFGFSARAFGQPVLDSEVVACIQGVAGVAGVDLDGLSVVGSSAVQSGVLSAPLARMSGGVALPAVLLLLSEDAADVVLSEVQA